MAREYELTNKEYSKDEVELFAIAEDIKKKIEQGYPIFDKDKKAALKTLKHAEKLVKKNKQFFAKDSATNALDIQIAQIEPVKQKKK